METIKINDKEYILKEEYDKLKEEKKDGYITEESKERLILEPSNVMAIVPNREFLEETFDIKGIGFFKEFKGSINAELSIKGLKDLIKEKIERVRISNTIFSVEYINKAFRTAKAFIDADDLRIFLSYDKEKDKFEEDKPCLLVFDNLVFALAPRIESEDK